MNENDRALVVMYHYVRESIESSSSGIRPLLTGEFEEQLDWLEENYRIVSPEEFLSAAKGGYLRDGKAPCLLTFDDGTRDHLDVVAPILMRRSLSGVFFVLTWPSDRDEASGPERKSQDLATRPAGFQRRKGRLTSTSEANTSYGRPHKCSSIGSSWQRCSSSCLPHCAFML